MRNDQNARKKISESLKLAYKEGRRKPNHLPPNSGSFKKGIIPWNKGTKGIMIAWNKDKKGLQVSWNKGKKGIMKAWNKGKKLPNQSGEKHPGWIKDRSKLKTDRRHAFDSKYKIWMRSVKNRDGWKCRIQDHQCSGRITAHHVLPWVRFPELRYEVNNGITLCHFHHPRKKNDEMRLSPFFQKLVMTRSAPISL